MHDKSDFIPLAVPTLGDSESAAANRVIKSGWITQGPEVAAFEQAFAQYVDAPYACAVSSCTAALHLALLTAGVKTGDEVVTVSHTHIASANSIRFCGGIPVFVDIQPTSFNINPDLIEAAISNKTVAILCVHQMGLPCDLIRILKIADRYNLPVIEDAACAIGSEININGSWDKIGKPHGDIACFSFHPRKVITTGDGGMLTTREKKWDTNFRLLRNHGMNISDEIRHRSKDIIFETYPEAGYNYRMTDIQGAIGREQILRLPDIIAERRQLAQEYFIRFKNWPELGLPKEPKFARSNWQSFCVRLPPKNDQKSIMQAMKDRYISTRRVIICCHRE